MNKKRIISSILLCAFAILFAHSIIPHHHHDETMVTNHGDHHDNDHDHDDIDHNFLATAFSHFQHESSNTVTYTSATSPQLSKFSLDKEAVLVTQYFIRQLFKPPVIHTEHNSFAFTPSIYSASSLFRGPPMA